MVVGTRKRLMTDDNRKYSKAKARQKRASSRLEVNYLLKSLASLSSNAAFIIDGNKCQGDKSPRFRLVSWSLYTYGDTEGCYGSARGQGCGTRGVYIPKCSILSHVVIRGGISVFSSVINLLLDAALYTISLHV